MTEAQLRELARVFIARLESPAGFSAWLELQGGEVGKSGTPCDCPLARFLQTTGLFPVVRTGHPHFRLTISKRELHLYNDDTVTDHALPPWAVEFVWMADSRHARSEAVSKEQAQRWVKHAVGVAALSL